MINLNPAHDKVREEFAKLVPEDIARRASVDYDPATGVFTVPFLSTNYFVKFPGGEICTEKEGEEVPLASRVCILHYLTQASDYSLTGRHITFKELPNGSIYVGPFTNRAIRPLVSIFGSRPDKLIEAGEIIGGKRVDAGDWAVTVNIFPKIPVTFVLWEGDDEFPASGNVLFDSSAPMHLETEDYALLPGLALFAMKKKAGL
ncbi:MAG: DUF3786 domain-containing protein [Bacillota bacterium]